MTEDYNGASQDGFGKGQYTIRDGRRSSSSRAFLDPARGRKNLTIITGAHITRVLMRGTQAYGVEYVKDAQTHEAHAERETIVSAGAFCSPQILMLSGIGPAAHLREMGIAPLVDLPVGQELQDHLGLWITYRRKRPGAFHREMRFDRMALSMLQAYFLAHRAGHGGAGRIARFRAQRRQRRLARHRIHVSQRAGADAFVVPRPSLRLTPTAMRSGRRCCVPKPRRSSAALADPFDRPRICYNFFGAPGDLPKLRGAVRLARAVGDAPAMEPYRAAEVSPGPDVQNDDEIDAFIRKTAATAHHPTSTCRMGATGVRCSIRRCGCAAPNVCESSMPLPCPISFRRISTPA